MHTPGPWVMGYDPSTHEDALVSASGSVVAYAAWDGGSGCHLATKNPADRQLIAAAPDLLEALERVLAARKAQAEWDDSDTTKRFDAMLREVEASDEAARAAIARATGADA